MTTTRVITEKDIVANRAAGYTLVSGQVKNQNWVAPQLNTTADGSLYFSLRDLLAWDAAVKRRAILRPESWQLILAPVRLNSGKSYPYGFGWGIDDRRGQPLQQHGGGWQGFRTQYSRFLGEDLSIIVLANIAQADPRRVGDGIATIVNPRLAVSGARGAGAPRGARRRSRLPLRADLWRSNHPCAPWTGSGQPRVALLPSRETSPESLVTAIRQRSLRPVRPWRVQKRA